MEKTVSIKQKEAYLQGWQDAADALTTTYENALRAAIETIEVPNFEDDDDNTEKSQG
jgi:hypothetical protein